MAPVPTSRERTDLKLILENIHSVKSGIDTQQLVEPATLFLAEILPITEQKVAAALDYHSVPKCGLEVFVTADFIDDTAKGLNQMEQVEDDLSVGTVMLDAIYVRLPHVDCDRFNSGLLLPGHNSEEKIERLLAAAFAHPNHPAGEVVKNHSHIIVASLQGDFIDGQDTQAGIIRLAEFSLNENLIDRFDGLGIQLQVTGYVLNGHDLTKLIDILSQPEGNAFVGIGKAELPGLRLPALHRRLHQADTGRVDSPAAGMSVLRLADHDNREICLQLEHFKIQMSC